MPSLSPPDSSFQSSQDQSLSQEFATPHAAQQYRPSRPLPYELRQHCIIYFEEGLYTQALTLLASLLVSGSSTTLTASDHSAVAAYIPSPTILALLTTLTVHPSLTTRSNSDEKLAAANQALYYLSQVNAILGPQNAKFRQAFQQLEKKRASGYRRGNGGSIRSGRSPVKRDSGLNLVQSTQTRISPNGEAEEDDDDVINTPLASDGSLWACAADFWHIVGWSFNCAVRWRQRWDRWKLLLRLLLQILEDDWADRLVEYRNSEINSDGDHESDAALRDSIVMQLLAGCRGTEGGSGRRRLLRAVFANGSDKDVAEFNEIFPRETAARKSQEGVDFKGDRQVDIEAGEFGDYYENDDEDEIGYRTEDAITEETRQSRHPKRQLRVHEASQDVDSEVHHTAATHSYGGHEAVQIRHRILVLLSSVSGVIPNLFVDSSMFFDIVEEYLRPLPLPVYVALLTPRLSPPNAKVEPTIPGQEVENLFSPGAHVSLLQELARNLLPTDLPRNRNNFLTQQVLEKYYLPFPASSNKAVDNAKLSFVLESMIRLLKRHVGLDAAEGRLRVAVEKGIKERRTKVHSKGKKVEEEAQAWSWMLSNEKRMEILMLMIEAG